MAGIEEETLYSPSGAVQSMPMQTADSSASAEAAYTAIGQFIDYMGKLTTREANEDTRRQYGRIWTDAIISQGDLRRASGIL